MLVKANEILIGRIQLKMITNYKYPNGRKRIIDTFFFLNKIIRTQYNLTFMKTGSHNSTIG